MTRKKKSHLLRWALAGWAVLLALVLVTTVLHVIGWIAATAALMAISYMTGKRNITATVVSRKLTANSRYGKRGQFPPPAVHEMNAVSAYPARYRQTVKPGAANAQIRNTVRREVSDGLASLGWPKRETQASINQAIMGLTESGTDLTSKSVLTEVLRTAGERKGNVIRP